jgi:hypothetical protein
LIALLIIVFTPEIEDKDEKLEKANQK